MAYKWTDNPTESGKANCNTDVLNECLMHLKYDALTQEQGPVNTLLETLYPIGAIYIGTMATCPLTILGLGTWQLVAQDRVLQGSGSKAAGSTIEAGLPNITGNLGANYMDWNGNNTSGAFSIVNSGAASNTSGGTGYTKASFDASRSNSIYGKSNTVQPPAYVVNIWKRIS